MWEPDRGHGIKGGQGTQGFGEDKEDRGISLSLHQIIDFAPANFAFTPAPTLPVFQLHPPTLSITLSH